MNARSMCFALVCGLLCSTTLAATKDRVPPPAPALGEMRLQDLESAGIGPKLYLVSTYGTGDDPANRNSSGAFICKGVLNNDAGWIWNNNKYCSKTMLLTSVSGHYVMYGVKDQNNKWWVFKVDLDEDPQYKDHAMWVTPPGEVETFFQWAVNTCD